MVRLNANWLDDVLCTVKFTLFECGLYDMVCYIIFIHKGINRNENPRDNAAHQIPQLCVTLN